MISFTSVHVSTLAKGSLVLNLLTPDWVEMRTSARTARTQSYDPAPAMNWDHAVSWGRGVWVFSVSDSGRVGLANRSKTKHIRRDKTRNPPPNPLKIISYDQCNTSSFTYLNSMNSGKDETVTPFAVATSNSSRLYIKHTLAL